jgi:uncharacterized protein YegL
MKFYSSILVTFILLVSFSVSADQTERSELVVILDTSGSMQGRLSNSEDVFKIEYAKREISKILDDFSKEDKFDLRLIHFSGSPVVTDFKNLNVEKYNNEVYGFIQGLPSDSSTPLAQSVDLATDIFLSSSKKNKSLLILSDGQDDNGISSLLRSMNNLNTKTDGSVMVQFFAIGVDRGTWRDFNQISQVIKFGTLFLVESTEQGGDFFELTADAISGSWSSSQMRSNVGKRLGSAHAEHVHIISSLDRSSTRDRRKRLKTINWAKLQKEDPDLYVKLKSWFEDLEKDYNKLKVQEIVSYLLNNVIRPQMNLDETRISNFEVYKAEMKNVWEQYLEELRRSSMKNDRQRIIKEAFTENDFNGPLDYVSAGAGASSVGLQYTAQTSIVGSSTSALSSATVDLLVAYLIDELTDQMTYHELVEIGSRVGSGIASLAILAYLEQPKKVKAKSLTPPVAIAISSLLSSASVGNSFMDLDVGSNKSLTGNFALDERRNKIESVAVERQEQEYAAYKRFVEREESMEALRALFPMLADADIVARIERASKKTDPIERALIIFDGNQEYMEKIALAQVLTDEIKKRDDLTSSLSALAEKQIVNSGLRGNDELPEYIQAYFNNLKTDLNNSEFNKRVDLFLLGVSE